MSNQNPQQSRSRGHNQTQSGTPNPNGGTNEDFNLRETSPSLGGGRVSVNDRVGTAYDLVEQMNYIFVKVVKAKGLPHKDGNGSPDPLVELKLGQFKGVTKCAEKNSNPEWNQVFAVLQDKLESTNIEVCVNDKDREGDKLIGMLVFDISEIPRRVPPDSPLAPQWYTLESRTREKVKGQLMLAIWIGTQADEAFPEAWNLDATAISGDGFTNIRSKVYLPPRLWYLRVNVIEAVEVQLGNVNRQQPNIFARVGLGSFCSKTKISASKNLNPQWNEDLIFVVAEPFEEQLVFTLEDNLAPNKDEFLGKCVIPLQGIEKRLDFKTPVSRWYGLEKHVAGENGQKNVIKLNSRVHLRISLDGGYHVLDELTYYSSDFRPTAKQLGKPPIGVLELGILTAQGLLPMKTKDGRGMTDAYCVAKYGQKWIRTRTVLSSFNPKWNEQYTWEVYDPCTVITIGVFDNCHLQGANKNGVTLDSRIGKVRIRLSTLETNRVYSHSYPLIVLSPGGVKKMGEVQLAVRFTCFSLCNMLLMYSQPMLPILHHLHPLTCLQIDILRHQATQTLSSRLSRAEPPLRREVVEYMLDVGSNKWGIRRCKANYARISGILSGLVSLTIWFDHVRSWKNPYMTIFLQFLFLLMVFFPRIIFSTVLIYIFFVGLSNYRKRPRHPPHMDVRLSHAETAQVDELDEEFDTIPTSKQADIVRLRYDRLRIIGSRMQTLFGDFAAQVERITSLLCWRDPRATALFLVFCLIGAVVLFVTPFKMIAALVIFYVMRIPKFRNNHPSAAINFFKRLPAKTDNLL